MSRKFIAAIVTAAITVTAVSSAPARADEEDVLKFIFGAAALFAIANALDDNDARVSSTSPYRPVTRPEIRPRPLPDRAYRAKPIPARCLKYVESRKGNTVRLIGQKCVKRHYRHVHLLPDACRTKVKTDNGVRRGYGPKCLRRQGFRLAHS